LKRYVQLLLNFLYISEQKQVCKKIAKATAHKKEVPPMAMTKRRCGEVKLEFIKDRKKRQHTRHVRKNGLFKKVAF